MLNRLFPRLLVLLLLVLAANVIVALVLVRVSIYDTAVSHGARSLEAKIVAADALLALPDRPAADARLAQLGIERRQSPPTDTDEPRRILAGIEKSLAESLAARSPNIVSSPRPMLWIAAAQADDGWIGIPLPGLGSPLRWSTALALPIALIIITLAAAIAARLLAGPLRTLAAAAPEIAHGGAVPRLPAHATTETRDLADALGRAAEDVRRTAREREIMLAGLSHDMRTPLARLGVALEMIQVDDDLKQGMVTDVAELDAMTRQFIAFVRDGRDEPMSTVDIGALLDDALTAQARAGRDWTRLGAPDCNLRTRPLVLRRAVDNLLENAARHGAAPLEAELAVAGGGVRITVRDRGPGVADDSLGDLGRPFFRVDAARKGAGSGLGLAIAARCAAANGGTLRLRNRDGGGFEAVLEFAATS